MAAVTENRASDIKKLKTKAKASLALLVVAVISISTATYAWFTLSNSTSVQSMMVEVSTGVTLKAYADGSSAAGPGADITKYHSIIKSEDTAGTLKDGERITEALPSGSASLADVKLFPVTSGNGYSLYTQGGNSSSSGIAVTPERKYYMNLTFYFIADTDMFVYLNGAPSTTGGTDGTKVSASDEGTTTNNENAVKAMRISFEDEAAGTAVIYEPGKTVNEDTSLTGKALADAGNVTIQNTFTDLGDNAGRLGNVTPVLFELKKGVPKKIVVRMWVEGEDAQCTNNDTVNIEKAKVNVQLRFSGADKDGNFIETPVN